MRLPALLPALLLLIPAASPAGPLAVHEWKADPADPRPYAGRVPHGSAARLVARLPGTPASATFHWQTNGMGSTWWEAPAEASSNAVSVLWTPAMDTGAAVHRAFFRIEQPEGPDYSAFATLAMLDSPGFVPNALPLPVQVLDFAAVSVTNAPWALADDLADYATTGQVAEAIAAIDIPDPDLSAYATTGLVSSLHPPFQEYASATWDRIAAAAVPAGGVYTQRLDAAAAVGHASGYALRALRSTRSAEGFMADVELAGAWSIVGSTNAATLVSNVLYCTRAPGAATVEFTPADGSDSLRAAVSMPGDAVRAVTVWPSNELEGSWRDGARVIADAGNGPVRSVATNVWNGSTYICTNRLFNTPWTGPTSPNPAYTGFAPPLWYAARRGADGTDIAGGLLGVAPHYALCAAHCGHAYSSTWITDYATGASATTTRGTEVATWGDLRLVRVPEPGVPEPCRATMLRSSVLSGLSQSLLVRALGNAWTQHGTIVPCLLEPRPSRKDLSGTDWDHGWTYVGPGDPWYNSRWDILRPLSHTAHRGDSGHPVFFAVGANRLYVPVGLFHWASGSNECLLSDALLDKIDAAIQRDSGGAEAISYYTAEELQ